MRCSMNTFVRLTLLCFDIVDTLYMFNVFARLHTLTFSVVIVKPIKLIYHILDLYSTKCLGNIQTQILLTHKYYLNVRETREI